jgi:ribosome-associated toxin RatA of RatAB toxin-antitoxin module
MVDPEETPISSTLPPVSLQIEVLEKRQRQIEACIDIPCTLERLWQVLTDYEGLADFIPNLMVSRLVEHPEGGIRLEQVGAQRILKINFSARVVLDMTEDFPNAIHFQMVEGDFKDFSGAWLLDPWNLEEQAGVKLTYRIKIWPKRLTPVQLVEYSIGTDMPINLRAIYGQAIGLPSP